MSRLARGVRARTLALTIATALLGAALLPIHAAGAAGPGDGNAGAVPKADWCNRTAAGPGGTAAAPVDLSAAHNVVREFSVSSTYAVGDQALADALTGKAPFGAGIKDVLQRYGAALDDVCVLKATRDGLDPAGVKMVGTVAVVTPGEGDVHLPDAATLAVVDLRDLPAVEGAGAAVRRAVGAARVHDLGGPTRFVRSLYGPRDEWDFDFTNYATQIRQETEPAITATGPSDRPIVFLTGRRTAPDAAALAGELRLAGEAWILGEDLFSATAESAWRGIGDEGLAVRAREAVHESSHTSDVLSGQVARQDTPEDPTTASYRHDIDVTDALSLSISTDGTDADDLDIYLLRDANNDGTFAYPDELLTVCCGPSADESITLQRPDPGRYQIWIHGFAVPNATTSFDLAVEQSHGSIWPDVIPADASVRGRSARQIAAAAAQLVRTPPSPVAGGAARAALEAVDPFGKGEPTVTSRETTRAALIVAHGMIRRFYQYFDVVGDTIDGRLLETLQLAEANDATDRQAAVNVLRRFTEAFHDDHASINEISPPDPAGFLPVVFQDVSGRPAIRRSLVPGMNPGDVITAIDGRPIDEVVDELQARVSAARPGVLNYLVYWRLLTRLRAPTTYTLEDPDGVVHTVTAQPETLERWNEVDARPYPRASGPLGDLGAANLFYLNMSYGVTPTSQAAIDAIGEAVAAHAEGLVLDMRHYPADQPAYNVAKHLLTSPALSAFFGVDRFTGPDGPRERNESQATFSPLPDPSFDGPIVLLTDAGAISAAESFMQVLVGAGRLTAVVGRTSGGTTGERTSAVLPGGYLMRYTGMHILNPDGSRFHGIGIVPDIPVAVTAADLRDGIDRDILTAIDVLNPTGG